MNAKLVQIGTSRGVIIPKKFLVGLGIKNELDMEIVRDRIIFKKKEDPRKGWEEAFSFYKEEEIEDFIDNDSDKEWTW